MLDLRRATGPSSAVARALNAIGYYHALQGDQHQALSQCQQALALCQAENDHVGQAETMDSLGYIHYRLGEHQQAAIYFRQALSRIRTHQRPA